MATGHFEDDRPEHLEMRKVVHGYFTPKSTEAWRPFVQSAIYDLLDEAEAKGRMDVMRDFATPHRSSPTFLSVIM